MAPAVSSKSEPWAERHSERFSLWTLGRSQAIPIIRLLRHSLQLRAPLARATPPRAGRAVPCPWPLRCRHSRSGGMSAQAWWRRARAPRRRARAWRHARGCGRHRRGVGMQGPGQPLHAVARLRRRAPVLRRGWGRVRRGSSAPPDHGSAAEWPWLLPGRPRIDRRSTRDGQQVDPCSTAGGPQVDPLDELRMGRISTPDLDRR